MGKKIFVFLHAAKSGGSSFWHSLVNSLSYEAQKNKSIILDLTHFAKENYKKTTFMHQQISFLNNIESFYKASQKNLIIHYHAQTYGLDDIFDDLKPKYIVLIRNAEERLISAYKWFLIKKCSGINFDKTFLPQFKGTFLSSGYQDLIPNAFNLSCSSKAFTPDQVNRILPIPLNSYNNIRKSDPLNKFLSDIGSDNFKPMINSRTISDKQEFKAILPERSDEIFWKELKRMSDEEDSFNQFLFEMHKSNI